MLRALDVLVGEWSVELRLPGESTPAGGGTTTFEWLPGGAHLLQRSTVDVVGAPSATCVIGCDAAAGRYLQLHSDDRDVQRVYEMTFDGSTWELRRDGEPFPQRFVGELTDGGDVIDGRWEKGDPLELDFHLTYRRR